MLEVLCADCWEMELCSKILCADYARLGFYDARHYAQHYARATFIMRDIMRGACNATIHYARIMRAWCFIMRGIMRNIMRGQLTLCAKCLPVFCTLPSLAVYAACPMPVQQPLFCPHTSWHG